MFNFLLKSRQILKYPWSTGSHGVGFSVYVHAHVNALNLRTSLVSHVALASFSRRVGEYEHVVHPKKRG